MDRIRNEQVWRRAGIERELASRADHRVLTVGHVERIDEYRMAIRVLLAEVSGGQERGRQVGLDGWCEGGLGQQGNDSGGCVEYQKEGRALVRM